MDKALVGDGGPDIGVPRYGFDDLEALAGQLRRELLAAPGDSPTISLMVDGPPSGWVGTASFGLPPERDTGSR